MMKRFLIAFIIFIMLPLFCLGAQTPRWLTAPIRVYIDDSNVSPMMENAFNDWESKSKKIVLFKYVAKPERANIEVYFINNGTSKTTSEITHQGYYLKNRIVISLNNPETGQEYTNDELYKIMLREIGYSVGLPESHNEEEIMYPELNNNQSGITAGDLRNLYRVYYR